MLYDLSFLNENKYFPPTEELSRLKRYSDNRKLFKGDTEQVFKAYADRIKKIYKRFADEEITYKMDINYHKIITLKTGDMVCGEPPTISVSDEDETKAAVLEDILKDNDFAGKLLEAVYDISRLGESIARIKQDAKNKFILISPDMWFPVVNREDVKEITQHVLCWIEERVIENKTFHKLRVQIHEKGRYINRTYDVKQANNEQIILPDGENVIAMRYKLGAQIEQDEVVSTGLDDFAIVQFPGTTLPDSIFGIDDYDAVTPIIAEMEVRYALEAIVLDKHTAPTMYGPETAISQDRTGKWDFKVGGYVACNPGEQAPGYLIWDAALPSNHETINNLKNLLFSVSEMGAVLNDEAFGASQGFEALETRLTNAKLKARRIANKLTAPVKKIIHLVSLKGYKTVINETDVSIYWNDGLPYNEYREADIAIKKAQFFDTETILEEHFGKSPEDAEHIAEKKAEENKSNAFIGGFSNGIGGGINDEEDGENGDTAQTE